MKCVVCGAEFEEDRCPACGFFVVYFPGDAEEGLRKLQPQIAAYRQAALDKISVGVLSYRWKGVKDYVVLDREERREIAAASALKDRTVWLNEQFARDPQAETLELRLSLRLGKYEARRGMTVPNLKEARLQELGASLDADGNLRLHLRNGVSESTGAPTPLFPLF